MHGRILDQQQTINELRDAVADLRAANVSLRAERDAADSGYNAAQREVDRLRAEVERLTAERDSAQEAADAYRAEKADARATAERLTRERDELLRGMPDADDYAALDVRCGTFDPSVQVSGGPTVALSLYQKALRERDQACSEADTFERAWRSADAHRDAIRARLDAVEAACRSYPEWRTSTDPQGDIDNAVADAVDAILRAAQPQTDKPKEKP